ncbi:MAG: Hsp20/alpha crystallin family protein [Rhodospirillales bacterium]|nr:Hsp20/alpha crystallin family protein [Rhodospirillales bacterium]
MANAPVEVKRTTPVPDTLRSFRADMDRLFDRFAGSFGMPSLWRMFDAPGLGFESSMALPNPAVDIAEDATAYKVTAELPGMSEKDIEVMLSGDRLMLKGEKRQETEQKEENFHLAERTWGSFQRSFLLPQDVDREKIAAEFAKGVLTLTLPKTAQAQQQQKQIEIKAAA